MRSRNLLTLAFTSALVLLLITAAAPAQGLNPLEQLGKFLFFDSNLSTPPGLSCASCHAPAFGFVGPDSVINAAGAVYPGVVFTRFGNRKPPTSAYGGDSPVLHYDEAEGLWIGGMFWDGRATGWSLGDPLAEQAQGPFLNPLEQNMPSPKQVCLKVQRSDYADLFEQVWGEAPNCVDAVETSYIRIALSIAAYERSEESQAFTSKYDAYLAGEAMLTEQEKSGLELFEGKAMCSLCHISEPGLSGEPPLFTDFTYDNLGVPKNPENPFYAMPPKWNPDGYDWVDSGLGGFLQGAGFEAEVYEPELGKVKVPTLRNVDLRPGEGFVKAFGHNGYFKSLDGIVHFYNTRDVKEPCPGDYTEAEAWEAGCWPAPEVPMNVNEDELGDLGLTPEEEAAIVAFMRTLSDGYTPP